MSISARRLAVLGLIALIGALAYLWHRHETGATPARSAVDEIFRPTPASAVPCEFAAEPRPLRILVLGQSNAGNHGPEAQGPSALPPATFFFQGHCYQTAGPAPGATGRGGNIWTALSPLLVKATGRRVVFSVFAVESTQVRQWVEPGRLRERLIETLAANREHAFVPDIVVWQQGEADTKAGTTATDYGERLGRLMTLLREQGVKAPLVAALSTRCRNSGSEQVRAAMTATVGRNFGFRLGPDTDTLTGSHREADCHFSASGLTAAAELWLPTILANL